MSFVAIVKTAKDKPPWSGLPDDYPVACQEFDTWEAANKAWPGRLIMSVAQYKEYSKHLHDTHPSPIKSITALVPYRRRWWQFWNWFKK